MGIRSVSGFVLLVIILAVIFFAPFWVLPIAMSVLSGLAVHELLYTTRFCVQKRLLVYSVTFSAMIPVWIFFDSPEIVGLAGLFVYVLLIFIEGITEAKGITFEKICGVFFASVIIPYFLGSIIRIAGMPGGRVLIMLPILGAFSSDVFALFVGKLIGKRKLCPDISPNKTVEGSIGGLVFGPLGLCVYAMILGNVYGYTVNYYSIVLYGLAASFAGQIGDLSMSYIKRQYNIKDFGSIIPGHGGILDRFDSVLFAAPMIELLLHIIPAIGG
jgi:phosphatidate cytidylyltransferase